MSVKPPPLPSSVRARESNSFACQAANVCLVAPVLVIALSFCLNALSQSHQYVVGRPLFLTFGFVALGLTAIGLVSGIVAVGLSQSGQRAPVFIRTGCGLALLGLLAAIAVPNFVRARTKALQDNAALRDVDAATAAMRSRAIASLTNSNPQPVDTQPLQKSFSRAADKASGDTAAMLKGSAAFLQRLENLKAAYEQALRELLAAKVLATDNLVQQAQIQQRKVIVTRFLQANEAVKTYVEQSEAYYRKELDSVQMSSTQRDAALNGFRKSLGPQAPLLVEIRNADARMGNAMLGILDLLDNNWERWEYNANISKIRFEDPAVFAQYNAFQVQIRQAAIDQASAQKRLAAVMSQPLPGRAAAPTRPAGNT